MKPLAVYFIPCIFGLSLARSQLANMAEAVSSAPFIWELVPSGVLVESRKRRRLSVNETFAHPPQWFDSRQNAVYATIPDPLDPEHKNNRHLQDFHRYRHLSRYEIQYRLNNDLDLQSDWDGSYDVLEGDGMGLTGTNDTAESSSFRKDWRFQERFLSSMDSQHKGGQFNNYQAVPLSQGYGTHYANLWIGSPNVQRKTLIVDTGSHYTAFPCDGCQNCGANHHTDPYFSPSRSSTFHRLQCDECRDGIVCENGVCKFRQAYTEGSTWEAVQVRDRVYCGGSDVLDAVDPTHEKYAIDFMFGCQTSMTGLFVTQLADGIIGLSAHPATLPKQLFDQGRIEHNLFSLCYRRELGTSKRGVHAGSMTLGGVSTSLDSSPIVYAKNMAKFGWFTVYVKNIYIRSGGGQSAQSIDEKGQKTVRVQMDRSAMNSGKGVIVDSGTTDTYLNKQAAREFSKAWKKVTGIAYSHTPISLTPEQLRELPTILIQCQSASSKKDASIEDYDAIPGYTGSLDPSSPDDLLIAVPATSYMDFSPITRRYMSRLYFTENIGSVLGSNTMQGHNVVFDWGNVRVGFSESSCAYDKSNLPKAALDDGYSTDCAVNDPVISKPCTDSVEKSLCEHNPTNIALLGTEKWTSIVENPGTQMGVSCINAANEVSHSDPQENPVVTCNGEGVCEEERPCQLTCTELSKASGNLPLPEWKQGHYSKCGNSSWSACDYNCRQTRINSAAFSDGKCYEVNRQSRDCHTGACARSDPCRVPFIVHAVVGFRGGSVTKWTEASEDIFNVAIANAVGKPFNETLFEAGDVHFLAALPWYEDEETDLAGQANQRMADVVGLRVVVEISIFNDRLDASTSVPHTQHPSRHLDSASASTFLMPGNTTEAEEVADITRCGPDTLHPFAKRALSLKKILLHDDFMDTIVKEIKVLTTNLPSSPFRTVFSEDFTPSDDCLILAWTIRTEVDDDINYFGPQKPFMATLYVFLHGATVISTVALAFLTAWSLVRACYEYSHGNLGSNFSRSSYREVPVEFDEDELEDHVIRGVISDDETTHRSRSRSRWTTLKQRFRKSSVVD